MTLDMFPEAQLHPEEEKDERYTPRALFTPLDAEFRFSLDACATAESAKCPRYFTKADDGLAQPWAGERVWCNPEYSNIRPWVEKAWSERAELVAMLLPAWTDRKWWHELVEPYRDSGKLERICGRTPHSGFMFRVRFLPGRTAFGFPGNPEGIGAGKPEFWLCLLIWRT
jgi:phage N-6-adenine-methyltransferase